MKFLVKYMDKFSYWWSNDDAYVMYVSKCEIWFELSLSFGVNILKCILILFILTFHTSYD